MPNLQLPCQLTQLVPSRRKKSTQQTASCKLRHPNSPSLGRATKLRKHICNFRRNRSLAITQHPACVLHQHHVLAQRKPAQIVFNTAVWIGYFPTTLFSIAFEYHGFIHPIEDQHHDELGHRPVSKTVRIEQLRQALTIGFHYQYLPTSILLHER